MALDEATAAFLTQMAESGAKPLHEMTPEQARAQLRELGEMTGPGPDMAHVGWATVTTADGSVPIRVLVPDDSPRALIVYYHGGGWVIGDIDGFDTLGRTLAQRTGCAVILVDYHLAPEYRYPTAVEDCWAALWWAQGHAEEILGFKGPVIVAGDSAGGNLAAIMAQRARSNGGPDVSLQVLVYPVTDCDLDNASYLDPENQLMLTRDSMIWFWDQYVPDVATRRDVDASPLRAGDLAGLAPAVVLTAEHDVLRDEGESYVERLRAAGVPVQHQRFAGQMHGFFTMVNVLPGSAAGIDYVVDAIERHLASQTSPA
jgi:acetyl esterase